MEISLNKLQNLPPEMRINILTSASNVPVDIIISELNAVINNNYINIDSVCNKLQNLETIKLLEIAKKTNLPIQSIGRTILNSIKSIVDNKAGWSQTNLKVFQYSELGYIIREKFNNNTINSNEINDLLSYAMSINLLGNELIAIIESIGAAKNIINYDEIINYLEKFAENEFVFNFIKTNKRLMKNNEHITSLINIIEIL